MNRSARLTMNRSARLATNRTLLNGGLSLLSNGKWAGGIQLWLYFVPVLTANVKEGSTGITVHVFELLDDFSKFKRLMTTRIM